MIEHDIVTVKKFGDKLALIKDGVIKIDIPVAKINEKEIYTLFNQ